MGDVRQVERAIMDLVSNAVEFTGAGGTVTVLSERSEGKVRISVADTGIGIAAAEQEAVFERFFRAGSMTSRCDSRFRTRPADRSRDRAGPRR